jgi:hypothetical protein
MKNIKGIAYLGMLMVSIAVTTACSSAPISKEPASEVQVQKQVNEKPKEDEETKAYTSSDAAPDNQKKGVKLPKGYPDNLVPIMPDSISGSGSDLGGHINMSYITSSSPEKVLSFYTDHFKKYGDSVIVADNKREINLDADGKHITIYIEKANENTSLTITIN